MGNITYEEGKHLIANLFGKVIELKQKSVEQDDIRCHFEIQVSEQEKQISDLRHTIQVNWSILFIIYFVNYSQFR